jgi:SNF2 family DNA or RNA helicase
LSSFSCVVFPFSTVFWPLILHQTQPWSAQDERQIRGRAHRQPQKKTVKAIHLLASDSSDLLMNDMALRKQDMFDAFVNKELGAGAWRAQHASDC